MNEELEPDYKAEITGPYPDAEPFRIQYFEFALYYYTDDNERKESWNSVIPGWTTDLNLTVTAKTLEKAESLARAQIKYWRQIDVAKNNKTEVR